MRGRRVSADRGVDLPVQVLELVLDRGLGLAADLAPDPPPGAVVAGRDLAAPPPGAVAVPGRVGPAITLVAEVNGVLARPRRSANAKARHLPAACLGACGGLWPATRSDPARQTRCSRPGLACADAGHLAFVLPW